MLVEGITQGSAVQEHHQSSMCFPGSLKTDLQAPLHTPIGQTPCTRLPWQNNNMLQLAWCLLQHGPSG